MTTDPIDKINKLSMPATILIASIILGGFYYATQISNQNSVAQQEQRDQDQRDVEASAKRGCVAEAMSNAEDYYKQTCEYNCKEGFYYTANYDSQYKTCLQREGII